MLLLIKCGNVSTPSIQRQLPKSPAVPKVVDDPSPEKIQWEWDEEIYRRDVAVNRRLDQQVVDVKPPDPNSSDFIDRTFYRFENCQYYYFGIPYNIDAYTSREILTEEDKRGGPYVERLIKSLDEDKQFIQHAINTGLLLSLERVRQNSIERRDKESMEAITFLHNVAKSGKKIVCVFAHGGSDCNLWGEVFWRLFGFKNKGVVNANKVAYELSKRYSNENVGAIFICSCNEGGIPIIMDSLEQPITLPVVAFTTVNGQKNPLLKIYRKSN